MVSKAGGAACQGRNYRVFCSNTRFAYALGKMLYFPINCASSMCPTDLPLYLVEKERERERERGEEKGAQTNKIVIAQIM